MGSGVIQSIEGLVGNLLIPDRVSAQGFRAGRERDEENMRVRELGPVCEQEPEIEPE